MNLPNEKKIVGFIGRIDPKKCQHLLIETAHILKKKGIDIDILLFDDEIIFYNDLKVPHPEMLKRQFVLVPLTEIAPNVIHPIAKKTILICLQNCAENGDIEKTDATLIRPISLAKRS